MAPSGRCSVACAFFSPYCICKLHPSPDVWLLTLPCSIHRVTTTQCIYPLCPGADPGLFPAWDVPELCCCERSSVCLWWTHVGISVGSTWGWSCRSPLCCDTSSQTHVYPSLFTPPRPPGLGTSCLKYGRKGWEGSWTRTGASGNPREVTPTHFPSQVSLSLQCLPCPWFELICLGRPVAGTRKSPKFALGV